MKIPDLKQLTSAGIESALAKANRYRLLNEPGVSESICRDVLAVDADNTEARTMLLLSLTDLFPRGIAGRYDEALELARSLPGPYEQAYYTGIVYERRAKAHHRSRNPHSGHMACEWIEKAMAQFAEAETHRPEGNEDALLRWNNCVRRLQAHPEIHPAHDVDDIAPQLGE